MARKVIGKARGASRFGIVTITLAVSMLMLTSSASASSPLRVLKSTAPYAGWSILQNVHNADLCGKGSAHSKITKPIFFNFSSGDGGMGGWGSSKACRNGQGTTGYVDQDMSVYIPIPAHSGHPTIYVNGTIALTGTLAFTAGHCVRVHGSPYGWCDQGAEIQVGLYAEYYDLNSAGQRTHYLGSVAWDNSTYQSEYCNGVNCTTYTSGANTTIGPYSLAGSFSMAQTVKGMQKNDTYVLVLTVYDEVYGQCEAQFFKVFGCSASASLNFGTSGNGFTLSSIELK